MSTADKPKWPRFRPYSRRVWMMVRGRFSVEVFRNPWGAYSITLWEHDSRTWARWNALATRSAVTHKGAIRRATKMLAEVT